MLLLNAGKQRILGFALTGPDGHFRFSDLPFGTYHVMADVPRYGRGMCEEITLSAEQPDINGLHLYISNEGRVCMRPGLVSTASETMLYPNPVDAEVLVGGLKGNTTYQVTVTNIMGMTMMPTTSIQTNLLGEFPMTVGALPAGVYFILVNDGTFPVMMKFVKR